MVLSPFLSLYQPGVPCLCGWPYLGQQGRTVSSHAWAGGLGGCGLDLRNPKLGIQHSLLEEHGLGLNPNGTTQGTVLPQFPYL